MNEVIHPRNIESCIYRIRWQQVIVDTDLARMYGVSPKRLNEQVRRNIKRFPMDFMFQLSLYEEKVLRSQIATLKQTGSGGHRKYRSYVFTEQGVAMLSGVLRSPRAIEVNIAIMRAFVKLRHAVLSSRDVARRVEKLEGKVDVHETDIRLLLKDVERLKKPPNTPGSPSEVI